MQLSTSQDKPRIVLDTNIVVSALIAKQGFSAKVFEKLLLGKIENYTSREITRELLEVFERKEIAERTTSQARDFVIEKYLENSVVVPAKAEIKIVEHAADNKFIGTAIDANAKFLITGDSHLLAIREFKGIKIITAKKFLGL